MTELTGARRTVRRRVLFVDTDAGGRIHVTAALRWAEAVEHRLVLDLAPGTDIGTWPRRHLEATYHRALGFDDEFELTLGVVRVGRSSVTWGWRVEREGAVWVEGGCTTVHVGSDGTPAPVPDALRARLLDPAA